MFIHEITYDNKLVKKLSEFTEMLTDAQIRIDMHGLGGCKRFLQTDYKHNYLYGIAYVKNLITYNEAVILFLKSHDASLKEQKRIIKRYIELKKESKELIK